MSASSHNINYCVCLLLLISTLYVEDELIDGAPTSADYLNGLHNRTNQMATNCSFQAGHMFFMGAIGPDILINSYNQMDDVATCLLNRYVRKAGAHLRRTSRTLDAMYEQQMAQPNDTTTTTPNNTCTEQSLRSVQTVVANWTQFIGQLTATRDYALDRCVTMGGAQSADVLGEFDSQLTQWRHHLVELVGNADIDWQSETTVIDYGAQMDAVFECTANAQQLFRVYDATLKQATTCWREFHESTTRQLSDSLSECIGASNNDTMIDVE